QHDYLYVIAKRTLGDAKRYREIIELNKDRPQPDGGRLTDPRDLHPGWVLLLPADAKGPDVRIGPLPDRSPTGSAPPPSTSAATPGPSGDPLKARLFRYLLPLGALVLMVILLTVLRVKRRGRSAGAPELLPAPTLPPPAPPRAGDLVP